MLYSAVRNQIRQKNIPITHIEALTHMTDHNNEVKHHAVWGSLIRLGTLADSVLQATDNASDDDRISIARLKAILEFTGKRLESSSPLLISINTLDLIASAANTASTQLENITTTEATLSPEQRRESVRLATQSMDGILPTVGSITTHINSDELGTIRSSSSLIALEMGSQLDRLRDAADAGIANLSQLIKTARNELESLEQRVDSIAENANRIEQQVQQANDAHATECGKLINSIKEDTNSWRTNRDIEASNMAARYDDEYIKTKASLEENVRSIREAEAAKCAEHLDAITKHRKEVEQLVGVIGNLGLTSGFQKEANYARNQSIFWHAATVLSMLFLIGIGLSSALNHPTTGRLPTADATSQNTNPTIDAYAVDWYWLGSRVVLAVVVGVLSKYSATQADRYLSIQRGNRKLELELAALGPYLEPLPEDKRQEFRLMLGKRTFGRQEPTGRASARVRLRSWILSPTKMSGASSKNCYLS